MSVQDLVLRSPIALALGETEPRWDHHLFWGDVVSCLIRLTFCAYVSQGGDLALPGGDTSILQAATQKRPKRFAPGDGDMFQIARDCGLAALETGRDRLGSPKKAFPKLERLVNWRNQWTGHPHSHDLDPSTSLQACRKAETACEEFLEAFEWFNGYDWLYVRKDVEGQPGCYRLAATLLQGSPPAACSFESDQVGHVGGVMLLHPDRTSYLALEPLVRWEACSSCAREQLFTFRSARPRKRIVCLADRAHDVEVDIEDVSTFDIAFGWHERQLSPQWDVLFVCAEATCRSPMAAAIAKELLAKRGEDLRVAACGVTLDLRGVHPNATAAVSGVRDVARLEADRWTPRAARLVVAMEPRHAKTCRERLGSQSAAERVHLLSSLAGLEDVPFQDPFDGDEQDYENAAAQLRDWIERAYPQILARVRPRPG